MSVCMYVCMYAKRERPLHVRQLLLGARILESPGLNRGEAMQAAADAAESGMVSVVGGGAQGKASGYNQYTCTYTYTYICEYLSLSLSLSLYAYMYIRV